MSLERRRQVGWIAAVCLSLASAGLILNQDDVGWTAPLFRIGIVLGSLWLAISGSRRTAAWSSVTSGRLLLLILVALVINRLKYLLPLIVVTAILAWIVRPRRR